jgi:sulfhydrogenase subunit delta
VNAAEFIDGLLRLVNGLEPVQPDFSVCYQCKLAGNACLLDKKHICLGPIAMGGCEAACTSVGSPCLACRGPYIEADLKAYFKTLENKGLKVEDAKPLLRMFMGKKIKEVLKE